MKSLTNTVISIIEKSGGQKPTKTAKNHTINKSKQAVEFICNSYKNHPSILKTKSNIPTKGNINDSTISLPRSSD